MPLNIRIAIAEWLECYAIPPPTRPASKRSWPEWERKLEERNVRLVRAVLAMEGEQSDGLDCVQSFEKAVELAKLVTPDLDYIAGMLWVALGEPAVSEVTRSETRLVQTAKREDEPRVVPLLKIGH